MKVSFVVPTKNNVAWLPHCVESVMEQTHDDIELIIINDGSTDTTKEYLDWLVSSSQKKEIKVVHLEKSIGSLAARNKGNKLASGEIIFVLDSDDYANPDRVKLTLGKIKSGAKYVYGTAEVMDFSGKRIGIWLADSFDWKKAIETKPYQNKIVHSSVAYTKEIAVDFPYFEDKELSDLGIYDWEHQIRLGMAGIKMDFIYSSIVACRMLKTSKVHTRDENKVLKAKERWLDKFKVLQCV